MDNNYETSKLIKSVEKIEELSEYYLKVALNRHKSWGLEKIREQNEYDWLSEIVEEAAIIGEILDDTDSSASLKEAIANGLQAKED